MGDPLGIGPEVVVKALETYALAADDDRLARFVILGSERPLRGAAERAGVAPFWATLDFAPSPHAWDALPLPEASVVLLDHPLDERAVPSAPGPSAEGGRASFVCVDTAIRMAQLPRAHPLHADAIVTAPISKTSWDLARRAAAGTEDEAAYGPIGRGFPGHTELLAERFKSDRCAMLFVSPTMRVMLATIHVPLTRVPAMITRELVLEKIELAAEACKRLGVESPRIGVCGLNPHAGEGGLLGEEDEREIAPAVASARGRGIDAHGPMPADTLFGRAVLENGRPVQPDGFDCLVAMYHDQGLIPMKLAEPHASVNVTVGLHAPGSAHRGVIRTSPAHGTAFDIAGRNLASERSMQSAISLALEMIRRGA